jgi:hypothetical protein
MQLFDLKTIYQFQTVPGVDQYNMPLYDPQIQQGNQKIAPFPVYQGFFGPVTVNGINTQFYTQRNQFFDLWPNYVQNPIIVGVGDGSAGPYTFTMPFVPNVALPVNNIPSGLLRGHVDLTGMIAYINSGGQNIDPPIVTTLNTQIPTTSTIPAVNFVSTDTSGANVIVSDSGQFLTGNVNYGLLMQPGNAPFGNKALPGLYSTTENTINYQTGVANVTFPAAIPSGQNILAQSYFYAPGLPRACLFYNNIITLRNPPDKQYLVQIPAYLTPAAFLTTNDALPFGYMAEYLARGAARKIMSDTGDWEQFQFYEPLFREQELLVWKRSQRQFTATRTQTIYSQSGFGNSGGSNGLFGSGAT